MLFGVEPLRPTKLGVFCERLTLGYQISEIFLRVGIRSIQIFLPINILWVTILLIMVSPARDSHHQCNYLSPPKTPVPSLFLLSLPIHQVNCIDQFSNYVVFGSLLLPSVCLLSLAYERSFWLTLLSIISSNFIHIRANCIISFYLRIA